MYKLRLDGKILKIPTGEIFGNDSWLMDEYDEWINNGNTPEPEYTIEDLRGAITSMIKEERNRRVDALCGSDRDKRMMMLKGILLNRKRAKDEQLTDDELNDDAAMINIAESIDAIYDFADTQIDWVNLESTTINDLESYNVTDANWPNV